MSTGIFLKQRATAKVNHGWFQLTEQTQDTHSLQVRETEMQRFAKLAGFCYSF